MMVARSAAIRVGIALLAFAAAGCPQVLSDWSIGVDAAV